MFVIRTIVNGPFGCVQAVGGGVVRWACLQGRPGFGHAEGEILTELLAGHLAARPDPNHLVAWLEEFAALLEADLQRVSMTAMFAAVAATDSNVAIITAGDIRGHLMQDGNVQETTRDHVFESDPLPGLRDAPAGLPTRWLGGKSGGPPESHEWTSRPPFASGATSLPFQRATTALRGPRRRTLPGRGGTYVNRDIEWGRDGPPSARHIAA
jgi:hypothetical protein